MARIVLLRHAHSTANSKSILAGRTAGVGLSESGKSQAADLVHRIGDYGFDLIATSPLQRCHETLAPWMVSHGAKSQLVIDEEISEVDYGSWSGKSLVSLRKKALWKVVQRHPSQMQFPDGESLLEMQNRALRAFYRLDSAKGKGPRLLVSHGDVIKSLVAHALGMHLDSFQKIVIDPASLTIIDTDDGTSRLVRLNDVSGSLKGKDASGKISVADALGGSTGNSKTLRSKSGKKK
jgi:probable phosphoglycerate mutase